MQFPTIIKKFTKHWGWISLFKVSIKHIFNNYFSRLLPIRIKAKFNQVDVCVPLYFEAILPWKETNKPNYESGLVNYIDEYVNLGDKAVIIGAGTGVLATKTAKKVGEFGHVVAYEGASMEYKILKNTLVMNDIPGKIDIFNAIVGQEISLAGSAGGAKRISPTEVQSSDVLILDCEGSELEILKNISHRPEVILVESHGIYGCPSKKVIKVLKEKGYEVEQMNIADDSTRKKCVTFDICVIAAIKPVSYP